MSSLWSGGAPRAQAGRPSERRGRAPLPPPPSPTPTPRPLTTDVVLVGVVHLLHPPVAEGQLPHPVHTAVHARAQAQVGSRGRTVEAVGGEVVGAGEAAEGEETALLWGGGSFSPGDPWVGLGLAVSPNVGGCSEYLHSGRSSIRAFINFPNNGGILSSCQVGIHSLSFWYQKHFCLLFLRGSHSVPCMQWPSQGKHFDPQICPASHASKGLAANPFFLCCECLCIFP